MKILTEKQFKKEYDYYICDRKTGDRILRGVLRAGWIYIVRWNKDPQYMHYFLSKDKKYYVCESLNWYSVNDDHKLDGLLREGVDPLTVLEICDL